MLASKLAIFMRVSPAFVSAGVSAVPAFSATPPRCDPHGLQPLSKIKQRRSTMDKLPARAFAGGVELGDHIVRVVVRHRDTIAPALAPAVAQPEDAGPDVGRMVHDVLQDLLLALMQHRALDRLLPADGALVETARHAHVGDDTAGAHRGATVEGRLELRQENAAKLEEMRQTVDEKLQTTLEQRLANCSSASSSSSSACTPELAR